MTTRVLSSYVTMLEALTHEGADQRMLPLINSLAERIDFMKVAHVMPANDGSGHQGVREFAQPTGTWRGYNMGVANEASFSEPYREPTAMLESPWEADLAILEDSGYGPDLRMRMIGQSMAGMMKTVMTNILYGAHSTDDLQPNGIMTRAAWNTLSSARTHDNARGNASATANKTSMLLIGFGPLKTALVYPGTSSPAQIGAGYPDKNVSGMGITVIPLQDDYVFQVGSTTLKYLAARNHLKIRYGLAINDERFIQRLCNISTSNIDGVDDYSIDENVMIEMMNAMPDLENAFIFTNTTLATQLWQRINEKGNLFHTMDKPFGKNLPAFNGVPILRIAPADIGLTGGILDSEETVT